MTAFLIAIGGGLGAVLRAVLDAIVPKSESGRYPRSTLLINLSGSGLLGFVMGLGAGSLDYDWQRVVGIGVLGGFTTFSTAAVQGAEMILSGEWVPGIIYTLGMLLGAVGCAAFGLFVGISL